MKKNKLQQIIKFMIVLPVLFLMISCTNEHQVVSIEITNLQEEYTIETFKITDLELTIKYDDQQTETIKVNRYMLSEEDYNKLISSGNHEIVVKYGDKTTSILVTLVGTNPYKVDRLDISVNEEKYEVLTESEMFKATCTHDSQYTYVTVKVTLEGDYFFANGNVDFYYNDKLIAQSFYTISDNILTYKYKDPNWSPIV